MDNTPTAGAVEMARRIVTKEFPQFAYEIGGGHFDEDKPMKIALAAIIETTEAAARLARQHVPDCCGENLVGVEIAFALRRNDHLKLAETNELRKILGDALREAVADSPRPPWCGTCDESLCETTCTKCGKRTVRNDHLKGQP